MGLIEQLQHALAGAQVELAAQPTLRKKLLRALRLVSLVLAELAGTATLAPYGLHASNTHKKMTQEGRLKCIQYGRTARNSADVYFPSSSARNDGKPAPVVVFINGGVWSSGDAWQYAPLGCALSDAGAVVVIAQYTLWPQALVPQMVEEVIEAPCRPLCCSAARGMTPYHGTRARRSYGRWCLVEIQ